MRPALFAEDGVKLPGNFHGDAIALVFMSFAWVQECRRIHGAWPSDARYGERDECGEERFVPSKTSSIMAHSYKGENLL